MAECVPNAQQQHYQEYLHALFSVMRLLFKFVDFFFSLSDKPIINCATIRGETCE